MVGIARVVVWTSKVAEMKWVFLKIVLLLKNQRFDEHCV